MTFIERLRSRQLTANTMVCVGLDTDENLVPAWVGWRKDPVFEFNRAIIDGTYPYVCAYKFNYAFYAGSVWPQREVELIDSIKYIHKNYPEIAVILDSKFGDISNTSAMYAKLAFAKYKADAVIINPYLGQKGALEPFLERVDKGIIILCRTSNEGAKDFQDLLVFSKQESIPLYQKIASEVAKHWNKNGNCLLVVGGKRFC